MTSNDNKISMDRPSERWLYHEAGHAVVAAGHNIPFEYVAMLPGDGGEVRVELGPLDDEAGDHSIDEIKRWQEFYAAGAAAEMLIFGGYKRNEARVDMDLHRRLQIRVQPGCQEEWDADVERVAGMLKHDQLKTIARELADRKTLSEDEVWQLLGLEGP